MRILGGGVGPVGGVGPAWSRWSLALVWWLALGWILRRGLRSALGGERPLASTVAGPEPPIRPRRPKPQRRGGAQQQYPAAA